MIKKILIAFFCLSIVISCNKANNKISYADSGIITGPNMLMCPTKCCSGTYIEIKGTKYLFEQLPANSGIDLKSSTYPIAVDLDWKPLTGCSSPQTIEITAIRKK